MKINLPVQNVEAPYPKGQVLVSKTDTKGIINYANDAFIELSGFTKEELIGKNHNIVRHPDMPPEAFEDLWDTVKQGLPWKGIVKNRCKDGSYYWVSAFVVPIYKNGTTTGYMSVRSEPTRDQISKAEALYQRVKSDKVSLAHKVSTWDRIPLKTRFMGSLGGILFCLLLIGGLSAYIIEKMQADIEIDMVQDEIAMNLSKEVWMTEIAVKTQVQEWKNILLRGQDDAAYEKYLKSFTKQEEAVQRQLLSVKTHATGLDINLNEIDALLASHKELGDKYRMALKDFNRRSATGYQSVDAAVKGMDRGFASGLESLSKEIVEKSERHIQEARAQSQSRLAVNRTILVAANIFAIIVAGLMLWMLINMMKTVRQMIAALNEIAHGNLDNDIPTDRRDELGIVLASLASMQVSLRVMMDELRISVANIFSKLRILDRTAQDTRTQSNTQNDRVMEVSAAMEEVAVSVAEVAKNATQVLDAAQGSLAVVNQGSASMSESLAVTDKAAQSVRASSEKINELNNAVQQISGATKVIKEIADQTNLLALNAAIEAARAGEQGRGFAVVADEVRKLAEKTGTSTTDITRILEQVIIINSEAVKVMAQVESQVNDARQNLHVTEESFGNIRGGSQQVTEMARSIADATKEQATANQAVANNMEKMSQGVEKTSVLVNELHDATAEMNLTAEELKNMLSQFNVEIR